MKITPYQANAQMLRDMQRVIHEKNLHQLERLNHQSTQSKHKIEPTNVWARPNKVDVMVWDISFWYCYLLAVKMFTDISVKTQTNLHLLSVKSLDAYLLKHAQNT